MAATRVKAFTLVEAMISIVIALLLIIGISRIFSIAQRTTGGGGAVLAAAQLSQQVQIQLATDFRNMVNGTDSPGIVIYSFSVAAFESKEAQQNDADGQVATINGYPNPVNSTMVNSRVHRVDKICFFVRNRFERQTSDVPNLVYPGSSNEAFIWLGHLDLPNNKAIAGWTPAAPGGANNVGAWPPPGFPSNPGNGIINDNNYFANSWVLGREVILMERNPGNLQTAYPGPPRNKQSDPLSLFTAAVLDPGTGQVVGLSSSRFDLAATSIDDYRRFVASNTSHDGYWWWQHLIGSSPDPQNPKTNEFDVRYTAQPFVRKPPANMTAQKAAAWMTAASAVTNPVLARGCSQFIVEFAGDFITQNPQTGQVSAGPDGQIDYIVDPNTGLHSIRWYGFPRDASDDGTIDVQHGVVPLGYVQGSPANPAPSPIERDVLPLKAYLQPISNQKVNSNAYIVGWGSDSDAAQIPKPKMIRITIALDDPDGNLNEPLIYEYVFDLP